MFTSVTDIQGLRTLKTQAKTHPQDTLTKAAQQFEALFLQQLLKNMRTANTFLEDDSPLKGRDTQFFVEMLDKQRSLELANKGILGIAKLLQQQLNPKGNTAYQHHDTVLTRLAAPLAQAITSPITETVRQFVKQLWPVAIKLSQQWGIDPKLLLAQAAHETGWGQFTNRNRDGSSSFNFFNIKAKPNSKEKHNEQMTHEYVDEERKSMLQSFKSYDSVEESFNDYMALIRYSPRYHAANQHLTNPEKYMTALQQAGYATDPNYASQVLKIYHSRSLSSMVNELEVR